MDDVRQRGGADDRADDRKEVPYDSRKPTEDNAADVLERIAKHRDAVEDHGRGEIV